MDDAFENAVERKLEEIHAIILQRRDNALQNLPFNKDSMGVLFANGAAESLIWAALQRAKNRHA